MAFLGDDVSLKSYNTFGIDATARKLAVLNDLSELAEIKALAAAMHLPLKILGGGSNILLTANQDALVMVNALKGISILFEDDRGWILRAAAGELWHELVMYCVAHEMGGIENLSLIPGFCGAAPMQNIGAYGVEIKDVLQGVEAIELETGEVHLFSKEDCMFGYRESFFKHDGKDKYLITAIQLRLKKAGTYALKMDYGDIQAELEQQHVNIPTMQDVSNAVIAIRQSKLPDPKVLGNAGSFFKNPEIPTPYYTQLKLKHPLMPGYPTQTAGFTKVAAGWLIEQTGYKGKQIGNTGSHARQALVLVNYGGATGPEVWNLALEISDAVFEQFGIRILPEVNIW